MVKDEFKYIAKNKLMLLSVLVIMIIPFLYCAFFLKSVWDPYGDTKELPVAVVNNDKAVRYNGTALNVGAQTVAKLKQNDQLGWDFVSAEEAKAGMKDNKYYTVVTIPRDFSKNAATVLSSHPKKMQLHYETNDSLNYLSNVISGIGVDALDKQIRANVTNAYASALFDQIKGMGKQLNTAATGATQLSAGAATLDDGISTYTVGVSTVKDGIQTLSVKVAPLSSKLGEAATGATTLANGVKTYTDGTTTLANGVAAYTDGTKTLANGVQAYTAGTSQIAAGVKPYTEGVDTLAAGTQTMAGQTTALPASAQALADGSATLNTGLTQYVAGVTNVSGGIDQLAAAVSGNPTRPGLAPTIQSLATGFQSVSDTIGLIQAQLAENKTNATTNQTQFAADYQAAITALTAAGFHEGDPAYDKVVAMKTDYTALLTQSDASTTALNTVLTQMKTQADGAATSINTQLIPSTTQLATSLATLQAGTHQLVEKNPALTTGSSALATNLAKLNATVPTLVTGINQLNEGATKLAANNQTLNGGLSTLVGTNAALNGGANQLIANSATLNNGATTLTGNNAALTQGANTLATGLTGATTQLPQLTSGVDQLLTGATTLTDNNATLTNGTAQLATGSETLSDGMQKGAKTINGIRLSKQTADMFASPTKTTHSFYSKVSNYGHALAPYVLSLALYVGSLVFNFAYPIRKVSKKGGTATQWFASKVAVGALVATGMALVEATLIIALGLTVENIGLFYLFAWLYSMAAMYLIMFLAMWLDNPGRFIAMILLMLQLGGAGGTFPMEITNGFYNAIHPFLPMTYSTLGFRQAISGGIASATTTTGILVLIGVTLVSLALLWVVMQRLQHKHLMGVSQLDDNQALQAVES